MNADSKNPSSPQPDVSPTSRNALRAYQRRTKAADALIASAYLSGTNTRRVRCALAALFGGAVSKDTVSRVWRKVQTDWDAWNTRSLRDEPVVRLILDGTVVRVRLDKKATAISLLVVIGVREDGQKLLLAVKQMGGETTEAWRAVLDDLTKRGLRRLFDDWIDPIETGVRARVRDWIEALIHSELDTALQRPRYGRSTGGETELAVAPVRGYRNGCRTRTLTGTFGKTDITVPRARLQGADGATTEWKSVPVQRCTVHKHRNLLACAPERLYDEITADYTDMIYAETPQDIADRRKAFIRKWQLRHKAVADSLEEAGDALFAFVALPKSQWKSARTTNAIERLHEEFKRRIKTQTVLPSADTAAMLFWALLASGQIVMRKIDGWNTLSTVSSDQQQLDAVA